jgi:choline dehydrogenase-like flavoprotein
MQHTEVFDLAIVGTGFAAAFFLKNALASPDVGHVIVLERGKRHSYDWQLRNGRHNDLSEPRPHRETGLSGKWWNYNIGFGGGSNCCWTNAMRIHPADF